MITIDVLLQEFGARIGLPDLALDGGGTCRLEFGDLRLDLQRDANGRTLLASCLAAELPDDGRAPAMARLLAANALFAGTRGGTIGVPEGSGAVVLSQELPVAAHDAASLEGALAAFLEVAASLAALVAGPAGASAADAAPQYAMMRV